MIKKLLVALSLALFLCGCSDNAAASAPIRTTPPAETSVPAASSDPAPDDAPIARLQAKDYDGYQDVPIVKGASYTPISRFGYHFDGYQDDSGVTYIDSDGIVIRDYNGTGPLTLWAQYSPEEYTFVFCNNGNELSQFNEIVCKFDSGMSSSLPIGETIIDSRGKPHVITGLSTSDGKTVITYKSQTLCPKDFFTGAELPGDTISLNIETTPLTYIKQQGKRVEVHNGDYLKQNFDGNGLNADAFPLTDDIDIAALKALGYKHIMLHYECVISGSKGAPRLLILSALPEKSKDLEAATLYDSEKIKDKTTGNEETFKTDENGTGIAIDINKVDDTIYIVYKSDTIFDNVWTLGARTLELTFTK